MSSRPKSLSIQKKGKQPLKKAKMKIQTKINDAFSSRKLPVHKSTKKIKVVPSLRIERIKNEQIEENKDASEEQSVENMLHQFDLNWEYGPSIGVTRLERWKRAEKLGLNPPQEIKDAITNSTSKDVNKCVWDQKYKVL